MNRYLALIFNSFLLFPLLTACSINIFGEHYKPTEASANGKTFARTEFVEVIPKGQTRTIPDGKNCTNIDDLFFEGRTVTLSGYSICKYEVTQELYAAVMGSVPCTDEENCYPGEIQKYRPVGGVNWFEACVFCNKLSEMQGLEPVFTITNISYRTNNDNKYKYISSATITWDLSKNGYRLPTEAEWEFASRGAGKTAEDWNYKYSGSDNPKKVAWTSLNSTGPLDDDVTFRTHEVGLKKANALGIYDMSGNVSEWCLDWYRSVTEDNDFSHGNRVKTSVLVSTDPIMTKGKYDNHCRRGGDYRQSIGYALNSQRAGDGMSAYAGYGLDSTMHQGIRLVRRF